ncbi:hypothetical protein LEP1GSC035_1115 [Leptospira noguchii str. 2007001578]|uniref:Uncharacterized protein n=1 Tax=Leptospira noguchii str. 2007001578 TaxID=1049974 RepID=A0ABP2T6E3_9LEPT|nr:hypothetical protein LEP1GSC035_1115 [Leptospira noguchii str. 2007001578]
MIKLTVLNFIEISITIVLKFKDYKNLILKNIRNSQTSNFNGFRENDYILLRTAEFIVIRFF